MSRSITLMAAGLAVLMSACGGGTHAIGAELNDGEQSATTELARAHEEWSKTCKGYRPYVERTELYQKLTESAEASRTTKAEILAALGAPNSTVKNGDNTICTYMLHRGSLGQIVFDSNGAVRTKWHVRYHDQYNDGFDYAKGAQWTVTPELGKGEDREAIIGMWLAVTGVTDGWWEDKWEIAQRLLPSLEAGLSQEEVRAMLGEPQGRLAHEGGCIWTYTVTMQNVFLQVWLDQTGALVKAYARRYDMWNGNADAESKTLGLSEVESSLADKGAWKATKDVEHGQIDRRGIGKRMEMRIKVGMTREEAHALMGEPDEVLRNGQSCYYNLHTDSSIGVEFDDQDRVLRVRHIGT